MKKIFLAFSFLCFAQGFSQIAGTDKDIMKNLCRKWTPEYIMINGKRTDAPKDISGQGMIFSADFTYKVLDGTETPMEGNWSFDAEGRFFMVSMNGADVGKIVSLTMNEMVFVPIAKGANADFNGAEIHMSSK